MEQKPLLLHTHPAIISGTAVKPRLKDVGCGGWWVVRIAKGGRSYQLSIEKRSPVPGPFVREK